ncbi:MAG: hypothetical protein H6924_07415 [Alphaproteobacteria bacterium]|nr:hypothetical protein [Alphaproteobacteria bacterium]
MTRPGRLLLLLTGLAAAGAAHAQNAPDVPVAGNPVDALEQKLASGQTVLTYADDGHGWLQSLLAALDVSPASQVLPFTRSSLQFDHINPEAPRAVYFNDDISVAAVHDGGLIEILANDPRDGLAFYTLDSKNTVRPKLEQQGATCVACHGMVNAQAPGWIVANVTATADGTPVLADPVHPFDFTDQTTPFARRWGGWYVTGTSEGMTHRGNVTVPDPYHPFDLPPGHTLASLSGRFDLTQTLKPTSDIVALMVLEHQTGFTNRAFALDVDYSDKALDALAAYMTFADEVALPGPVSGNSGFTADFAKRGPRDGEGRSLRDFDLKTRLFRYPLSYMIYSSAFDALKPDIKQKLYRKLYDRLRASADGRTAIAIAAATRPGLPDFWK